MSRTVLSIACAALLALPAWGAEPAGSEPSHPYTVFVRDAFTGTPHSLRAMIGIEHRFTPRFGIEVRGGIERAVSDSSGFETEELSAPRAQLSLNYRF